MTSTAVFSAGVDSNDDLAGFLGGIDGSRFFFCGSTDEILLIVGFRFSKIFGSWWRCWVFSIVRVF